MSIQGRVRTAVKETALWAALGITVFLILLTALGFLIAGFFGLVHQTWPHFNAGAITGGFLLVFAAIILLIGSLTLKKTKKRHPSILTEFTGMAGLAGRIAGVVIRKDPRKSIVLAVLAGAVAEYITSGDRKKR